MAVLYRSSRGRRWRCRRCRSRRMEVVLAATSPDGKGCIGFQASGGTGAAAVVFDPATTEEEAEAILSGTRPWARRVRYMWAAGAPAVVGQPLLAGGGKAEVLFMTADQHIRCPLLLGVDGTLWAGSDGSGVIYRFATVKGGGKTVRSVFGGTGGRHGAGDGCCGERVCRGCRDWRAIRRCRRCR